MILESLENALNLKTALKALKMPWIWSECLENENLMKMFFFSISNEKSLKVMKVTSNESDWNLHRWGWDITPIHNRVLVTTKAPSPVVFCIWIGAFPWAWRIFWNPALSLLGENFVVIKAKSFWSSSYMESIQIALFVKILRSF